MSGEDRPPADQVEHARLQKALRESLILRELADILNSSLDLEPILQKLVTRTTELCEVTRCAVWLLEESSQRFRPVTYYVASSDFPAGILDSASTIWYRSPLPIENPVIQRLLAGDGMLFIEDLRTEPGVQNLAQTFQTHSVLLLALIREGRPVGMMSLDDPGQTRTFSHDQQQLARAIAQQATIAIDNARLFQQAQTQQKRAEHLIERARAIYQVAMTVNSGEELPAVLRLATDHLVRSLEAHDGLALLFDADETTLRPIRPPAQDGHLDLSRLHLTLDCLPNFQRAVQAGKPMLVSERQAAEQEITWFQQFELKNILVVPLMGSPPHREAGLESPVKTEETPTTEKDQEVHLAPMYCPGLIVIHYKQRAKPTRGEYAFAQDIAAQCALAIEKARLLSEAQRAAELANERANTLDAVFQAMTEGITVITPDEQVFIRNNAAAQFLGVPVYSSASLKTFLQRHPAYTLDGLPISYENFPLTRALHDKIEVRGERVLTTRADGEPRAVELTATPLRNHEREQIGLVTAFRDITVQVQAEQRVRRALETFLHIAEAVSYSTDIREILHSVLSETLKTLRCKRGTVHLFQQGQATFEPLLSLGFAPDEEARWLQEQQNWLDPVAGQSYGFYAQLMQGHAVLLNEEHRPTLAPPFETVMVLAAPIKHDQQILGLLLLDRSLSSLPDAPEQKPVSFTNWDVTIVEGIAQLAGVAMEQARWQQEAIKARADEAAFREANAMKDEFLAITAHEFRNPLTIILARSQSAQRTLRRARAELPPPVLPLEEHLETIATQTKQLNNIVTTFLDAARINQGQFTLRAETVDLAKIARQVVKELANLAEHHTLECLVDETQKPYLVKGDQARLAQIIANLVENAIKYSPLGGPVTVSLRKCGSDQGAERIEVSVRDRGMGIPPDAQARLFERFYRVSHAASGETRGIGLGLYIVSHLVQMHGGKIYVESSGVPGEGSCFLFTLPALALPAEIERTSAETLVNRARKDS